MRDFIHVVDLAKGHIAPVGKINAAGLYIYNLGTGQGISVLELVKSFSTVNNIDIPYKFVDRRLGDLPVISTYANKANDELGWKAEKSLTDICQDGWKPYIELMFE